MLWKEKYWIVISLLIGAIVFIWAYGTNILNPLNEDWIFAIGHDLAQFQIGWEFFREEPMRFPFGVFNSLTYPMDTSIINTASVPIVAVILKMFSKFLPDNFQYVGLWGLVCLMLQGLLGTMLCRRYTKDKQWGDFLALLGGCLFVLTPLFFHRFGMHASLAAHWLILMCFIPIVYFEKFSTGKKDCLLYAVVGFLTIAIHAYFIAICGVIVLLYSIYKYIKTKDLNSWISCIFYILAGLFSTWIFGGFHMNAYISGDGLYMFNFNLVNFFNPLFLSSVFKPIRIFEGQYEGFAYLGLGVFFLLLIVLFSLKKIIHTIKNNKIEAFVWTTLIIASIILATLPLVSFGEVVIFKLELPSTVENVCSVFRSVGRYIFIANYVIVLLILMFVFSNFKSKIITLILLLSISLQAYDLHRYFHINKIIHNTDYKYETSLKNDAWNELSKSNKINMIYMPIHWEVEYHHILFDVVQWAFKNKYKMNNIYSSRPFKHVEEKYIDALSNPLENDIFIFVDNEESKNKIKNSGLKHFYKADNFIISSLNELNGLEKIKVDYL